MRQETQRESGGDTPTEKQISYLKRLAAGAGKTVDVSGMSKREVSRLIDELRDTTEKPGGSGNGNGRRNRTDDHDRRIAFGMATKLVYQRYLKTGEGVPNSERFWKDVKAFFEAYGKEQERATALSFRPADQTVGTAARQGS